MATTYPIGSRFHPTRLGLVKRYLKDMVEKDISGFIKTLNVYGDAPWLLDHDMNPLYCRNEWYYFVPRTVRGVKTVSRMVPGNGGSFLGGTWKSTGTREDIKNKAKELMGYRRVLVFNKNVVGKSEKEKTDWHMVEYSLHKNGDEYHDLVLCHVRLLNSDERFKPVVHAAHQADENTGNNNDVVLKNQEQQEAGIAMLEYQGGGVNQHQQQQEQEEEQEDSLIPLQHPCKSNHNQRQYLLEDIVYPNGRDYLNQQQEQEDSLNHLHPPLQINYNLEHYPLEDFDYHGAEDDVSGYGLMPIIDDVNQQQDSPALLLPPLQQSNDNQEHYPLEDIAFDGADDNLTFDADELLRSLDVSKEQEEAGFANHNVMSMMVEKEHGGDVVKQHQQQQDQEQQHKDALSLLHDPELDDLCFDGGLIRQKMDVSLTQQQQLQEVEEEEEELLQQPVVPQPQDSRVHDADPVMPPLQSNDNHEQRPLVL